MKWWLKKQWLRIREYIAENYYNEGESLIIWYAVSYALGAAFYFALPIELSVWIIVLYLEAILLLLYLTRKKEISFKLLTYAAVFMMGLCVAKADSMYRFKSLEKKIPEYSYLRGKIKDIDYNYSHHQRILLTNVEDENKKLKGDYRISLNAPLEEDKIGQCVELVANLPQQYAPNAIGHYDIERTNYYKGISAIGNVISPIFVVDCENTSASLKDKIAKWRQKIKTIVNTNSTSEEGAIIKALIIGDKSSITETQSHNYRTSGLAHFLAISGMHMGMIALWVFFLIRTILFPLGTGRYDLRKPAAIGAIISTFIYFLISGQSISCIRAFIMTMLILLAILFNRRAISLRLWALAVIIVVSITPVAVVSAGFLMSFAAVLGLIAFYEQNRAKINGWFNRQTIIGKILGYITGLLLTDLIASLMTLPYSLYFFNQISIYTSLGNMLAGPIIVFWIMPCLLIFMLSIPLGLAQWAIKPLNIGMEIINKIADMVASLAGARAGENIGLIPDFGIFLLTISLLWLCIWQAKWRWWGIIGIILGVISVFTTPKPDFIFDSKGETYAYRDEQNQFKASPWHKNKFLEQVWTGSNRLSKDKFVSDKTISCHKKQCNYQNSIEFGKGWIKYKNKDIPLNDGGYINLKYGVIYKKENKNRLWNK